MDIYERGTRGEIDTHSDTYFDTKSTEASQCEEWEEFYSREDFCIRDVFEKAFPVRKTSFGH